MSEKQIIKLVSNLNKQKHVGVTAFLEGMPVKANIKILDIDYKRKQISWSFDKKLKLPLLERKELYFKYEGKTYILPVIFFNNAEIVTFFPSIAKEPKLDRKNIRIDTTIKKPVIMSWEEDTFLVEDISESGVGVVIGHNVDLKPKQVIDFTLTLCDTDIPVKGEIVYVVENSKTTKRIGIKFLEISRKAQDTIAKYIFEREKELIKKLTLFE